MRVRVRGKGDCDKLGWRKGDWDWDWDCEGEGEEGDVWGSI